MSPWQHHILPAIEAWTEACSGTDAEADRQKLISTIVDLMCLAYRDGREGGHKSERDFPRSGDMTGQ